MVTMKGAEQLSYDVAEVFEDGGTVAWKVGNGGVIERVDVRISTSDGERSDAVRVVVAGTDVQVKPPRLRHAEHGEGQGERRGACHAGERSDAVRVALARVMGLHRRGVTL